MSFVSYIEFNVADPKKAGAFYKEVLGWDPQLFSEANNYWIVAHGDAPGIDAGLQPAPDGQPRTVAVITVPNLDEVWAKALKAGATVAMEKFAIPTVGYAAYFTDPNGLVVGLHQYDADAK
jgi:predicted enzyme related to lactoylglutathione lyase